MITINLNKTELKVLEFLNNPVNRENLNSLQSIKTFLKEDSAIIYQSLIHLNKKNLISKKTKKATLYFRINGKGMIYLKDMNPDLPESMTKKEKQLLTYLHFIHQKFTYNLYNFSGKNTSRNIEHLIEKLKLPETEIQSLLQKLMKKNFIDYIITRDETFYYITYSGFKLFEQ